MGKRGAGGMSKCEYCIDEICVNDDCPVCADYCPVYATPDVCKWEKRKENKNEK